MNNGKRGGVRTPGPGKRLGRPALPEKAFPRTVRLSDSYVDYLTGTIHPELSEAIRILIKERMERNNESN